MATRSRRRVPASGRSAHRSRALPRRPRLEWLEERMLLAVYNVINNAASGPGSLAQAITDLNAAKSATTSTILFNITPTPAVIPVSASGLPPIQFPAVLDAVSVQP